jgi:DNA repair protein RadD
MTIILRDYQASAIEVMEAALAADRSQGRRHASVCAACVGAGKSILIGEMARRETEDRMGRVLVLAPAAELIDQDAQKVGALTGIGPGIYSAGMGRRDRGDLIVVASVQTLYRQPLICGQFSLILADEAHGIPPHTNGMWRAVLAAQPSAALIGFTGTPWRLESGRIYGPSRLFDNVTVDIRIAELQKRGHLVPIATKARAVMDAGKLKVRAGEYDTAEQEDCIDPRQVVQALAAHAEGRQSVLIFTPGVESGRRLTAALLAAGHGAAEVYGDTPMATRDGITAAFKAGALRFLVNTGCLTTGFDAPRTDCVVLLRRTMSTALLIQMVGRGLRLSDAKRELLLLDYAGNFDLHPAIDEIEPPIDGDEQPKAKTQRRCQECETLVKPGLQACPSCGAAMQTAKRDLAFGDPAQMQSSAAYIAKTADFAAMAAEAKARQHSAVSAAIKFKTKHGHWPTPSIGAGAGHPFAWTYDAAKAKRVMAWR